VLQQTEQTVVVRVGGRLGRRTAELAGPSWPTCCVKCGRPLALKSPLPPCPLLSAFRLTPLPPPVRTSFMDDPLTFCIPVSTRLSQGTNSAKIFSLPCNAASNVRSTTMLTPKCQLSPKATGEIYTLTAAEICLDLEFVVTCTSWRQSQSP